MTLILFAVIATFGLAMILTMSTLSLTPVLVVEHNSNQYSQIHQIRSPSISFDFDEDSNNLSPGDGNQGNRMTM